MKKRYKLLSYALTIDTYAYGGKRQFIMKPKRRISQGDSCNVSMLSLTNHIGTHIECPNHFYNSGKKLSQYKIEDFIFSNPMVLNCQKSNNEVISEEDIKKNYKRLKKVDLLLLKTGFFKYRGMYKYSMENPGIAPQAARFIRAELGNIRCIGIDSISVSPYKNRELGRKTHAIFFENSFKCEPVRLIEDMNLSGEIYSLKKVYVFPLFIADIDSSPCIVLGIEGKE